MIIAVVSQNEQVRNTVCADIVQNGYEAAGLCALKELPALLMDSAVSGIIIDLLTSARATQLEKQITNDIIQLYPHDKVKLVGDDQMMFGRCGALSEFLNDCSTFHPRRIRRSERRTRHIAFRLSSDKQLSTPEKVVTLNIGDGGCFLYSTADWKEGDRVWIQFVDNERIMSGVVRWWQPWGNNKKMPGIGVCFNPDGQ